MMLKKRVIKPLATAAGLLLSANVMAANFKMSVGDGEGSAQQVMGLKFAELLAEKTNNKHKPESVTSRPAHRTADLQ